MLLGGKLKRAHQQQRTTFGMVPGIWIQGRTDPNRITIEAPELAAVEIERQFVVRFRSSQR
jgi:hypothetical protein